MTKKAVLITGAARRIGRALAEGFAAAGYDIGLHYSVSSEEAEALQQALQKQGTVCHLFQADLRELKTIAPLMQQVQQYLPHTSVLINNASTFPRLSFKDTTPEKLEDIFAINFKAPFFTTQAFAATFSEGVVINMLDVAVDTNRTPYFAYLLAKKALREFTLMAAKDLAPGIRVNGILPGLILPSGGLRDIDSYEQSLPMKKRATPADIVQAALMLVEQPYHVGQCVYVDGGESLNA
jgi:pteridine reductase